MQCVFGESSGSEAGRDGDEAASVVDSSDAVNFVDNSDAINFVDNSDDCDAVNIVDSSDAVNIIDNSASLECCNSVVNSDGSAGCDAKIQFWQCCAGLCKACDTGRAVATVTLQFWRRCRDRSCDSAIASQGGRRCKQAVCVWWRRCKVVDADANVNADADVCAAANGRLVLGDGRDSAAAILVWHGGAQADGACCGAAQAGA